MEEVTIITATRTLSNDGVCFTKGQDYTVRGRVKTEAGLMERTAINDQGQPHIIGSWWRHFRLKGGSNG